MLNFWFPKNILVSLKENISYQTSEGDGLCKDLQHGGLKISPFLLVHLNALEKCLEVTGPKALVIVSLNNLNEHSRPVLKGKIKFSH